MKIFLDDHAILCEDFKEELMLRFSNGEFFYPNSYFGRLKKLEFIRATKSWKKIYLDPILETDWFKLGYITHTINVATSTKTITIDNKAPMVFNTHNVTVTFDYEPIMREMIDTTNAGLVWDFYKKCPDVDATIMYYRALVVRLKLAVKMGKPSLTDYDKDHFKNGYGKLSGFDGQVFKDMKSEMGVFIEFVDFL
jgi:hypothetical protein